jgi:hypothetical protein
MRVYKLKHKRTILLLISIYSMIMVLFNKKYMNLYFYNYCKSIFISGLQKKYMAGRYSGLS